MNQGCSRQKWPTVGGDCDVRGLRTWQPRKGYGTREGCSLPEDGSCGCQGRCQWGPGESGLRSGTVSVSSTPMASGFRNQEQHESLVTWWWGHEGHQTGGQAGRRAQKWEWRPGSCIRKPAVPRAGKHGIVGERSCRLPGEGSGTTRGRVTVTGNRASERFAQKRGVGAWGDFRENLG